MANEKLTWSELRKAVAQMASVPEQEAEQFLGALVDAILKGLTDDKQVKIKGIGTFALKAIAPRKSVNIATGEEFIIEGYNKLTFNAESMLKESVEKRLAQPRTEAVMAEINNDPIKKLGEQADEIVDLLADLGQAPKVAAEPEIQETPEVTEAADEPKEEVEVTPEVTEEAEVKEVAEEPKTPEVAEVVEKPEVLEVAEVAEEPVATEIPKEPKAPKKKSNGLYWAIVAILLALVIGAGVYFRETLIQWWQCMQDCQPTTEEVVEVEEVIEVTEVPLADRPREYVNFIGIERVNKDSRLAWIAYKHYAQKDLWVFIYEANRDIIKHPAKVREGQYIRIPDLSEEYRNLYNPELKQLVDSLAVEYLK